MGPGNGYCNSLSCSSDYCRCEQKRYNDALEKKRERENKNHPMRRKYDALESQPVYLVGKRTHMDIENQINRAQAVMTQMAQQNQQTAATPRARILNEAMKITHHDRNANYGNPEDNFQHIANLWNDYLRVRRPQAAVITAGDVAVMNMLIKVARLGNNAMHRDSVVDIAGYAACMGDIQEGSLNKLSDAANPVNGAGLATYIRKESESGQL